MARLGYVALFGIDVEPEELLKKGIAQSRKVSNFLESWARVW